MKCASTFLVVLLLAGCATAHPDAHLETAAAGTDRAAPLVAAAIAPSGVAIVHGSQQEAETSAASERRDGGSTQTVEQWSQDLSAAVAQHTAAPTVAHKVELAQAYVRAGILDQALEIFGQAVRLDTGSSAAWDGVARIWRDWGFPDLGLGHAHRAVWADPGSAVARNTLGTVLLVLGKGPEAREQFEHALAIDPHAAYALNNLCYAWLMEENTGAAAAACRKAIEVDPALVSACNNLGLVSAARGDLAGAEAAFSECGSRAIAQYNLGIVHLSLQRYHTAAEAFYRAAALDPTLVQALTRAAQARRHLADQAVHGEGNHERR